MRTKDAGAHAREKVPVELEKQLQLIQRELRFLLQRQLRERKEGGRVRQELRENLQKVTVELAEMSTRIQELENHLDWEGKRVDALAMQSNASSKVFCINHHVFDCCTTWIGSACNLCFLAIFIQYCCSGGLDVNSLPIKIVRLLYFLEVLAIHVSWQYSYSIAAVEVLTSILYQ